LERVREEEEEGRIIAAREGAAVAGAAAAAVAGASPPPAPLARFLPPSVAPEPLLMGLESTPLLLLLLLLLLAMALEGAVSPPPPPNSLTPSSASLRMAFLMSRGRKSLLVSILLGVPSAAATAMLFRPRVALLRGVSRGSSASAQNRENRVWSK